MKFRRIMAGLILTGLSVTSALAQKSLGDLLDGGAKKLSKEAVKSAIGGAQISGTSTTDEKQQAVQRLRLSLCQGGSVLLRRV